MKHGLINGHPRVPTSATSTHPTVPTVSDCQVESQECCLNSASMPPSPTSFTTARKSAVCVPSLLIAAGWATATAGGWASFLPAPAPSICQTIASSLLCDRGTAAATPGSRVAGTHGREPQPWIARAKTAAFRYSIAQPARRGARASLGCWPAHLPPRRHLAAAVAPPSTVLLMGGLSLFSQPRQDLAAQ